MESIKNVINPLPFFSLHHFRVLPIHSAASQYPEIAFLFGNYCIAACYFCITILFKPGILGGENKLMSHTAFIDK